MTINRLFFKNSNFVQQKLVYLIGVNIVALEEARKELHTADLQDGYDCGRLNLQSVTEQNNLDDFLATAELAGTEFTAKKLNIKFVSQETGCLPHAEELKTIQGLHKQHEKLLRIPRRPPWSPQMSTSEVDQNERTAFLDWRRSLASVQEDERIVMTPYEKNLDFWRQLWRVIERSDVMVQIVDARNPLLFYCADLEAYVKEVEKSKACMVLINKADFLNKQQREAWADYFTSRGIRVAFWSALEETARQEFAAKQEAVMENVEHLGIEKEKTPELANSDEEEDDYDKSVEESSFLAGNRLSATKIDNLADNHTELTGKNDDHIHKGDRSEDSKGVTNEFETNIESCLNETEDKGLVNYNVEDIPTKCLETGKTLENTINCSEIVNAGEISCDNLDKFSSECECREPCGHVCNLYREMMRTVEIKTSSMIYTGPELLELFKSIHLKKNDQEGLTTVGMVGYPNVGKSSTINAILKMKKVPVSATPGRTKHFQTLYVDPTLMLCDCPGLVFPSFVTTKANLVLGGILPIDQMRDYISPTALLCQKIPRWLLETKYGICLPRPTEGEDLDRPPTAHELLNTYGAMRGFMTTRGIPDGPRSARYLLKDYVNGKLLFCDPPPEVSPVEFNGFSLRNPANTADSVCSQGVADQGGQPLLVPSSVDVEFFRKDFSTVHTRTARGDQGSTGGSSTAGSGPSFQTSLNQKPWKKHNNRNKKEKLRRVYGFLDK